MDKQEIYTLLENRDICFEVSEHKAVISMKEISLVNIKYPEACAKNLFVRDDKKKNYYIITIKGDKKIDLKEFRKVNKTRPLSFASEDDLKNILGLMPGSVTPFGILNDNEKKVKVFIDKEFFDFPYLIGVHPNDNTVTLWLKVEDLIKIIKEHGNIIEGVQL